MTAQVLFFDVFFPKKTQPLMPLGNKYDPINLFLRHIIMSGLKMKNRLIQQQKVIKKNLLIYHT